MCHPGLPFCYIYSSYIPLTQQLQLEHPAAHLLWQDLMQQPLLDLLEHLHLALCGDSIRHIHLHR